LWELDEEIASGQKEICAAFIRAGANIRIFLKRQEATEFGERLSVRRLLVRANAVPRSPILVILM
jgi:hypothetical protein